MKTLKLKLAALLTLALFFPASLLAQSTTMEDGCMMMSGWAMFVWVVLVILLLVILVLGILALLKYLFRHKQ